MKIKNLALSFSAMALAAAPLSAQAAENLASDDFVGISFWLISMALMASTVFFLGKPNLSTVSGKPHW